MPNTKPRIQLYLSPWIIEALADYCDERKLGQSTAIEQILADFFNESTPKPQPDTERLDSLEARHEETRTRQEAMESRLEEHEATIKRLAAENLTLWLNFQAVLNTTLPPLSESITDSLEESPQTLPILKYLDKHLAVDSSDELSNELVDEVAVDSPDELSNESPSEVEVDSPDELSNEPIPRQLSNATLAKRLKCNPNTLRGKKSDPTVLSWTWRKDPDRLQWRWNASDNCWEGRFPAEWIELERSKR